MLKVSNYMRMNDATLIGPNCPGVLSPGKSNVSIMPDDIFTPGNVGIVSRSGTLTYQIVNELTQRGIGQSTAVGIGGDPIIGTDFIEILEKFEEDPETECVVMVGEIGGNAEQRAAEYIQREMKTPVVAYIAGFTAPEGKTMGHAGAIVSGGDSTAEAKSQALQKAGIRAATNPTEVGALVAEVLGR
jgi:succinyl-CoA synthetase alpha subunit